MNRQARIFATIVAASAMTGCVAAYEKRAQEFLATQPESAWGQKPQSDHLMMEKALTVARLKDPSSAQISATGELIRSVLPAGAHDLVPVPVYCSYLNVNAKNSYGGYTGAERWEYCYSNGELFSVMAGNHVRIWMD